MALTTSIITGRVPLPNGNAAVSGELTFRLVRGGTEGPEVILPGPVRVILTTNGDIPPGTELWQNSAGIVPSYYIAEATWKFNDRRSITYETQILGRFMIGTDASYNLSDLLTQAWPDLPPGWWTGDADARVTNGMLADMPAGTFKGRPTGSGGTPMDIPYDQLSDYLGIAELRDDLDDLSDTVTTVGNNATAAGGKADTALSILGAETLDASRYGTNWTVSWSGVAGRMLGTSVTVANLSSTVLASGEVLYFDKGAGVLPYPVVKATSASIASQLAFGTYVELLRNQGGALSGKLAHQVNTDIGEAGAIRWEWDNAARKLVYIQPHGPSQIQRVTIELAGVNQLPQVSKLEVAGVGDPRRVVWTDQQVGPAADWWPPLVIRALSGGDSGSIAYTGGNHGSNGDATGTPTAILQGITLWADGSDVRVGEPSGVASHLELRWDVRLMGYNTKTTGRYIAQQRLTAKISPQSIETVYFCTELEPTDVLRDNGLQLKGDGFTTSLHFWDGVQQSKIDGWASEARNSGAISSWPTKSVVTVSGPNGNIGMWIDPSYGIMTDTSARDPDTPAMWSTTIPKVYMQAINKASGHRIGTGGYGWRGGWSFAPAAQSTGSIETAFVRTRGGYREYFAIIPSGGSGVVSQFPEDIGVPTSVGSPMANGLALFGTGYYFAGVGDIAAAQQAAADAEAAAIIAAGAAELAQEIADGFVDAGSVRTYQTRALAVSAITTIPEQIREVRWIIPSGVVIGVSLSPGSTVIPDMPGWLPAGNLTPEHWGAPVGGVDASAAFNSIASYQPEAVLRISDTYRISAATFDVIRGFTIEGTGKLETSTGSGPVFNGGKLLTGNYVDVGFNGFSRVQYACDFLARHRPYNGNIVSIRLVGSTYQFTHGIHIRPDMDLSWVRIFQQSNLTYTLPVGFEGVTNGSDSSMGGNCVMFVDGGKAPRWGLTVDAQDRCGTGLHYANKGEGVIESGRGVNYASRMGLYVTTGADVRGAGCIFDYPQWGNRITTASKFSAPNCKMRYSRTNSYGPNGGTSSNLDISRGSIVYVTGSDGSPSEFTGGAGNGIYARRSFVSATAVDCSDNEGFGIWAFAGSVVAFDTSKANNNGMSGIFAASASISVFQAEATDNTSYNLFAGSGGFINGGQVTATGAGVCGAISDGGSINCPNSNFRMGADDAPYDIRVISGGYINASGGVGGVSQTACVQTASGMIVK